MSEENRTLRTVGILIFDEVEVLDFCGPFEVFSVAQQAGTVVARPETCNHSLGQRGMDAHELSGGDDGR